ncbi:hypothetical protein Acr_07g0007390 [Actinidia rufa]|uniref:Uncharacterized protein n=1 Tax=Actinidia rufa TaxID=165716 RepID=A0A7J0EVZ9_9ERIC|nr:hypothetical protein Acr_07g0007390 [Actinidia rufa]
MGDRSGKGDAEDRGKGQERVGEGLVVLGLDRRRKRVKGGAGGGSCQRSSGYGGDLWSWDVMCGFVEKWMSVLTNGCL